MKFEKAKIGALCDLITKGTTPTTQGHRYTDSGVSFVKVESLTEDGRIDQRKLAYIDPSTHEALKRSQLRSGDILFTIAGTIGRVGKVPDAILPANTNQAVALLRPNPDLLDVDFLLYSLLRTSFKSPLWFFVSHQFSNFNKIISTNVNSILI